MLCGNILHQWKFCKMAEQLDTKSGQKLLALCTRRKRLKRKMTKHHCWIKVLMEILACPVSHKVNIITLSDLTLPL